MRWLDDIERPLRGRLLGGVCAGLSRHMDLDPTLVRLAFLLLSLAKGAGLLLYVALWLLLREEGERSSPGQRLISGRPLMDVGDVPDRFRRVWDRTDRASWPRPLGRRWTAITMIAVGLVAVLASLGAFDWITPVRALGLALAATGAGLLARLPRT